MTEADDLQAAHTPPDQGCQLLGTSTAAMSALSARSIFTFEKGVQDIRLLAQERIRRYSSSPLLSLYLDGLREDYNAIYLVCCYTSPTADVQKGCMQV